jgi:hypothetical protein
MHFGKRTFGSVREWSFDITDTFRNFVKNIWKCMVYFDIPSTHSGFLRSSWK